MFVGEAESRLWAAQASLLRQPPGKASGLAVARAIPASEYVELPGTGHLTPVTDPEAVIGPVLDFFRRTDIRN